jgi:hypothetical protein
MFFSNWRKSSNSHQKRQKQVDNFAHHFILRNRCKVFGTKKLSGHIGAEKISGVLEMINGLPYGLLSNRERHLTSR